MVIARGTTGRQKQGRMEDDPGGGVMVALPVCLCAMNGPSPAKDARNRIHTFHGLSIQLEG